MHDPQRRVVVILGMHRSGTSLLAQLLQFLGVNLGNNLDVVATASNPDGHWEHAKILRIQHGLLESLGRGFFTPRSILPMKPGWWRDPALEPVKQQLAAIVRDEMAHSMGLWGFKDPRTLLLQPMWREIFGSLNVKPLYVVSIRHPTEVAQSLAKRDSSSLRHGELMWLMYNMNIARYLEGEDLAVVHYPDWFTKPETAAQKLMERLGLRWAGGAEEFSRRLSEIVKPGLWHQQRRNELAGSSLAEEMFRCLINRAPEPPHFPALKEFLRRFDEAQVLLLPWSDTCDALATAVSQKDDTIAARNTALAEKDHALAEKDHALVEKDNALVEKDNALVERDNALVERDNTIAELRLVTAQRASQIAMLEAERNTFGAQVGRWLTRQRNRWAPSHTRRDRAARLAVRAVRVWRKEGARGLVRKIFTKTGRAVRGARARKPPGSNADGCQGHLPRAMLR
ncbi:MAG: sulfotransferase family protein [Porticoccaceae bacterium]